MALIQTFVPAYRASDAMAQHVITQAMSRAYQAGHQIISNVFGGALADTARNNAICAVFPNVDFVLFMDDDMKPEPDAISKIVALNKPIASALCTTRSEPVALSLSTWDEKGRSFQTWDDYAPTQVIEGQYGVGAAFLCIRMDALRQVVDYYLSAKDWLDWNRPMLDRLKVRAENRERERERKSELRHRFMEKRGILRVFEQTVYDSEIPMGEDLCFCWKAMQCGIPVTVDPTIRVGHQGAKDYYVEDFIPQRHLKNFTQTAESLGIENLVSA